jgi:ATP-dependent RNA helicase DeaD
LQVHRELEWLFEHARARLVSCVGGMEIRREQRALGQGAHIVVGTPGRLRDHLERGTLDGSELRAVVLDEADEMLDLGFREDLEFILDAAPADRRTLLFSATIPREIAALAKRYQRDSLRVSMSAGDEPHGDIEYRALRIAPNEVEHSVVNVLRYFEAAGALVFCATREAVRHLYGNLLERGFAAVALSGELSQHERNQALQALRDGRARVCVATDVAARGIDLPDLGLVIHAELPRDPDTLLHRSGRTGRAGRKGISVLLVPYTRRRGAERLIASAKVRAAWGPPPSGDEIRARDRDRLVQETAAVEDVSEEERAAGQALLAERTPEEIAAALVRLYRSRLPAPEELYDGAAADGPRTVRETDTGSDAVWFRMNVGRNANADPRWLIPLICRRGHVTKREIGTIRIHERDTKFEIAPYAAGRFAAAVRRPGDDDQDIRIEPMASDRPASPKAQRRPDAAKRKQSRPKRRG